MPQVDNPTCYFCKVPVEGDEEYCYGCGAYICDNCDDYAQALGAHTPEEHIDDGEYSDEDDDEDETE